MSTFARTISGDLQIPRVLVTDPAQVARQTIIDKLSVWQGEWFLDQNVGFPWVQKVLGIKNPNITEIKALLRQTILSVPGVVEVAASATFNRSKRSFSYSFAATLNTGQTIKGGSGTPFTISGAP